jgi:hypothetical protein
MPQWIHDRAEHLLAKNPKMSRSTAFAIATQQSHKMGKSPKGYGTKEGKREARAKYDQPRKEYKRSANPGGLESPKMGKESFASLGYLLAEHQGKALGQRPQKKERQARKREGALSKKAGFAVSQYSGSMGGGPGLKYHSSIPPFTSPPVKTGGPPSKLRGKVKKASPAAHLAQTQRVGAPKATPPPGIGVGSVGKPQGFGRVLPYLGK